MSGTQESIIKDIENLLSDKKFDQALRACEDSDKTSQQNDKEAQLLQLKARALLSRGE